MSESSSSDEYEGTPKESLWDKFTTFTSPRVVHVQSPYIAIPYYMVALLIAVIYIIPFFYNLRFLEREPVEALATVELSPPNKVNWWNCSNLEGDCETFFQPHSELSYCREPGANCYNFALPSLSPAYTAEGETAVATSEMDVEYMHTNGKFRQIKSSRKRWRVAGIENYMLHVKTRFSAFDWTGEMDSVQGLIRDRNGSLCRIRNVHSGSEPYADYFARKYPPCGTTSTYDGTTAFSSSWGDYYGLKMVLESAGLSLDDELNRKGVNKNFSTLRDIGHIIVLSIHYENAQASDFWSWPFGPKDKYIVEFMPQESSKEDYYEWVERTFTDAERTMGRHDFRKKGLRIFTSSTGARGEFRYYKLVQDLAIISVLLGIARTFVTEVLLRIYKRSSKFGFVARFFYSQTENKVLCESITGHEKEGAGQQPMPRRRQSIMTPLPQMEPPAERSISLTGSGANDDGDRKESSVLPPPHPRSQDAALWA